MFIKDAYPKGKSRKVVIEVKTGVAKLEDIAQIRNYMDEIGEECVGGALIAQNFPRNILQKVDREKIKLFAYSFKGKDCDSVYLFDDLRKRFQLENINRG